MSSEQPDVHTGASEPLEEDGVIDNTHNENTTSAAITHGAESISEAAEIAEKCIRLEHTDFEMIQAMLRNGKIQKWKSVSADAIEDMFTTAETLNKELTGQELSDISKLLNPRLKKHKIAIPLSLRKPEKVNMICKYIGNSSRMTAKKETSR